MKRACSNGRPGRRGFTMIEMLTVIAIIAILAGILFPVFATVRKNVRKASCTTNLHTIQQALKIYRDDNGTYPEALFGYVDPDAPAGKQEVTYLFPQYIKDKQTFRCPLARFHTSDTNTVPAKHPTEGTFTRAPNRRYPMWDSYDGQFEPPTSTQNYIVKYVKHWSGRQNRGFGDAPRQLLYKNPPEDTVITWCTYHRDWNVNEPVTGSIDLVLFLDGHVKPTPSNVMHPISELRENHSYLVGRGD